MNLTTITQKAIIANSNNQILILERSAKCPFANKWSLPGGELEIGEDPYQAMKREIAEETRLMVVNLKPFYVKSNLNRNIFEVMIGYICKLKSGKVILNWEHTNLKWLSKEDALRLDLTPDGRTFIKRYKD